MTPSPSTPEQSPRGPLFAQFLDRPLDRPLLWVWLMGLSLTLLVVIGGGLGYQLFVKARQKTTSEYAVTGVISGMTQHLVSGMRHQERELQQVAQLFMHRGTTQPPNLYAVSIVRADGQADATGKPLGQHQRSTATAALAEHQRHNNTEMQISGPIQNQKTGAWSLQLSRRINLENGLFYGIVLSEFNLDEVEQFFSQTRFMDDSVAVLFHRDGRVLLETSDAGSRYSGRAHPLPLGWQESSAIGDPASTFLAHNRVSEMAGHDGIDRYYVWHKVPNYPLFVMKGVSLASIAQLTRPIRLTIMMLVLLAIGVILLATGGLHLYVRQVNFTLKQRQEAEQTLRNNEERLHFALAGSGSAEWELQLPEGRLSVSSHMASLLGYPVRTGPYEPPDWRGFVHPDDQAKMAPMFALRDSTTDLTQVVTLRARAQNGNYRWLQYRGRTTSRDAAGKATRLSGLARDVTEQQAIQAQMLDRTAQLDAIFSLSPDAYVAFDKDRLVKYVNPAFVTMTGWHDNAIKGMSEAQFSSRLNQLCIADRPFPGMTTMRETVPTDPGSPGELIELNGVPKRILRISLQLSDAPSVSQILYLRDVTHETIVEEMKTEFLATAAHELRTPMASIVGFAEILCTHPLPAQDQLEFAQIIWRQSLHLAGILDELLDLSRIEARGGKGLVLETIDLRTQLDDVIAALVLPQGRDAPNVVLPPLLCKADRGKVSQVLENILTNAYKFSGPGTEVSVTTAKPSQHATSGRAMVGLVIRDAGIGMTSEQLALDAGTANCSTCPVP